VDRLVLRYILLYFSSLKTVSDEHRTGLLKITGKEYVMKEHINQNIVSLNSVSNSVVNSETCFFFINLITHKFFY